MNLKTVRVGLIGAGRMGSFHAENLALRVPGARLTAVADLQPGAAQKLADRLGWRKPIPISWRYSMTAKSMPLLLLRRLALTPNW